MADEKELNPTEQMHKFAVDQVNHFKKLNKEEREKKLEEAKKEDEKRHHAFVPVPPPATPKPEHTS